MEEIYADLNAYTCETRVEDPELYSGVEHVVVLPPLLWEGTFIKGIVHGHGMDVTLHETPETAELFHTIANSSWCNYPWTKRSDALFGVYPNPHREAWFRETCPQQAHQILLPMQTADHLNEHRFRPVPVREKDIDLLVIARCDLSKNYPFLARCLKTYREKYPKHPIKLTMLDGMSVDVNLTQLLPHQLPIYREVESILIHPMDYIDFLPTYLDPAQLPELYSRTKLVVLGSLIEGKNRVIYEAMMCNTPVVVFQEYNQYIRGETAAFPPGAGVYAPFDPEGWADTIHEALANLDAFDPRQQILSGFAGRRRFLNACLNAFPYYRNHLPDFDASDHTENLWLDMAMLHNYQLSLDAFLYHLDPWFFPFRAQGMENWKRVLTFYQRKFPI